MPFDILESFVESLPGFEAFLYFPPHSHTSFCFCPSREGVPGAEAERVDGAKENRTRVHEGGDAHERRTKHDGSWR